MKSSSLSSRSFNLDFLRIMALVFIPCTHFFLNTGFYSKTVDSPLMFVCYFLRNLFILGLTLFMLLTGYLQGNKTIPVSKSYFVKITKFLIPYIIITATYLLVDIFYLQHQYTVQKTVETFTTFVNYSWYVEMYIGLFLLIPFLNMTWSCLKETKHEITLIAILIALSMLPSFVNSFSLSSSHWWTDSEGTAWDLIPNWWQILYPITYYFTGAFMKKHKDEFKLKAKHYFLLFAGSYLATNAYHLLKDYGLNPSVRGWLNRNSITLYIPTVFLFMFVASIDFSKVSLKVRRVAAFLSELCFGALIATKTVEMVIYPIFNSRLPFKLKIVGFPVIILIVLIIAFGISLGADLIYKLLVKLFNSVKGSLSSHSHR